MRNDQEQPQRGRFSGFRRRTVALVSAGVVAGFLLGCSTPERGESEIAYKNRLAKYTVAGVLIGGYVGTYHAKLNKPVNFVKHFGINPEVTNRGMLAIFYAALGGAVGHSMVKYEGKVGEMVNKFQTRISATTFDALEGEQIGTNYHWSVPEHKSSGTVRVTERYTGSRGFPCQDLVSEVSIEEVNESVDQTACRNAGGKWVLWTLS